MKVKYFKNYSGMSEYYVGEKEKNKFNFFNIVSISKDCFFLMANDECSNYPDGRFDGLYRLMKVKDTTFNDLKEAAREKDRVKGINLIKKIHESNPDKNPNSASIEGSAENFDIGKTFKIYQKSKPILD